VIFGQLTTSAIKWLLFVRQRHDGCDIFSKQKHCQHKSIEQIEKYETARMCIDFCDLMLGFPARKFQHKSFILPGPLTDDDVEMRQRRWTARRKFHVLSALTTDSFRD
jgi:hypothetical protein